MNSSMEGTAAGFSPWKGRSGFDTALPRRSGCPSLEVAQEFLDVTLRALGRDKVRVGHSWDSAPGFFQPQWCWDSVTRVTWSPGQGRSRQLRWEAARLGCDPAPAWTQGFPPHSARRDRTNTEQSTRCDRSPAGPARGQLRVPECRNRGADKRQVWM